MDEESALLEERDAASERPGNAGVGGSKTVVGIAAVQGAFCFLHGPADVLSASTACPRWRALACADSVWRFKSDWEGMREKARAFGLATTPTLPAHCVNVPPLGSPSRLGVPRVESAMAFYARIFVLKVPQFTRVHAYLVSISPSPPLTPPRSVRHNVTTRTRVQGYKMRDEVRDVWVNGHRLEGGIYTAVADWCEDRTAAQAKYGPIASWDTSEITSMRKSFNDDISRWEVGQVTTMDLMFCGASSFTRQLGGAWSASMAPNATTFLNSPGSIA